jgi:hypothetical protein
MDTGDLSSGVKGPGREADLLPPLVPKLRMIGDYTSTPPYDFTAWYLVKHRDNIYLLNFCITQ